MKYTSINIQGNLISEEILQKIEDSESSGQLAKDFGFEAGINIRSEIEYAWSKIKLDWKYFSDRTEKLPSSDPYGTSLSRKWMISFLGSLGFDLALQKASLQGANQQLYNISHTSTNLDEFPVHIVGFLDPSHPEKNTLDIRSSGGTSRLSPHATIQEYLNVTEYLYGMATNGLVLRLIRDSGHLVRMTYIEFDLKRLLEEDKYSEFTVLFRMLHPSRFLKTRQEGEQCFFERYYHDSIESGNRIRDGLSDAVKESLVALGNGLLEHPDNDELREKVSQNLLNAREFYHQLLRLIYRLLFLMVTEERDLVYPETQHETKGLNPEDLLNGNKRPTRKQKEIYYNYYSVARLRRLSQKRYLLEDQYQDLWQSLMQTFALFESGGAGLKLGIQALGSELFSHSAMPDISAAKINNRVLLKCIKSLNEFEDEKHNLSFINYRALDVEELGSVYEGLLELEPLFESENGKPKFTFRRGSERSKSGSHYTPEDLVKPLIQHSLEYLIEERVVDFYKGKSKEEETKRKLLDLKVCDVACGSGHILLSAARRIALEVARVETGEQQPNPASFRHSLKEVIKNCIYGVDKNPLAVELCKVALWLESHNPGEPLSFLDHKIKCGDAIVGLALREELQNGIADEAFKKTPGDDIVIASAFLKKNKQERSIREKSHLSVQLTTETDHTLMEQVRELRSLIEDFTNLPENNPEEVQKKEEAYRILIGNDTLKRLKMLADLQILPFFLEKIEGNRNLLITDAQYHRYLRGEIRTTTQLEAKATEVAIENRFFHWFIEFPEVFRQGGFNCIIGNPPFRGGLFITTDMGSRYTNLIKFFINNHGATTDLVAYFFRRIGTILKDNSYFALIGTNSISEGDTRENSLEKLLKYGNIIMAKPSIPWIGKATLHVSLIGFYKGSWQGKRILDNEEVNYINSYLKSSPEIQKPFSLQKETEAFLGTTVYGKGFFLNHEEKDYLIKKNPQYKMYIKRFINGDDVLNNPDSSPSRYVLYLLDFNEENLKKEISLYEFAYARIFEERQKSSSPGRRDKWWLYTSPAQNLYKKIVDLDRVIITSFTSKHIVFTIVPSKDVVFSNAVIVICDNSFEICAILQSSVHSSWVRAYSSTLETRQRYAVSDCYNNFPFPQNDISSLSNISRQFFTGRQEFMLKRNIGLTKFYNDFHDLNNNDEQLDYLRGTFIQLEKEVLLNYNWSDIELNHNFYELEDLPENDRVRFTIHPNARREILKRLLELNHKIHEEEVKVGLWNQNKNKKKNKESNSSEIQINEPEMGYGNLFNQK